MPWYALDRFARGDLVLIRSAHDEDRPAHPETHLLFLVNLAGLADRARLAMWPAAVDAFTDGVARDRIEHALGLETDEFRAGLTAFIRRAKDDDPQRAKAAGRMLNDSTRGE